MISTIKFSRLRINIPIGTSDLKYQKNAKPRLEGFAFFIKCETGFEPFRRAETPLK